jgi:ubiquinone/menaquinone biosynthesis C-methylase UbiE
MNAEKTQNVLSSEFHRRLKLFLGGGADNLPPAFRPLYDTWYKDHAEMRSEWFRRTLLWRIEKVRALKGLTILDFGCGTGCSTEVFSEAGATVVGVDPSQKSLDVAIQRIKDLNLSEQAAFFQIPYFTSSGETLAFKDASFDMVTLIGVLEHMKPAERIQCVREINRLLKENGEIFIFDTPNRLSPFDHHTTQLWLVNWLPVSLARGYAIFRGRFDKSADYERNGAPGITFTGIKKLFPPEKWEIVYRKDVQEVQAEYDWILNDYINNRFIRKVLRGFIYFLLDKSSRLKMDPNNWTPYHVLCLRKLKSF